MNDVPLPTRATCRSWLHVIGRKRQVFPQNGVQISVVIHQRLSSLFSCQSHLTSELLHLFFPPSTTPQFLVGRKSENFHLMHQEVYIFTLIYLFCPMQLPTPDVWSHAGVGKTCTVPRVLQTTKKYYYIRYFMTTKTAWIPHMHGTSQRRQSSIQDVFIGLSI